MKKGKKDDTEDTRLWRHVTKSVRPLKEKPAPAKAPVVTSKPKAAGEKPRLPPAPPPKFQPAAKPPAFDKGEEQKLRKGAREIEARIDLHGMGQAEAYDALTRFIARSRAREVRNLLVITGKGRVGGGVLRRLLPLWLEEGGLRANILAFTQARREDGGEGAFYIRLRKK
jgi:DNA-nicking Smr family endonuclease